MTQTTNIPTPTTNEEYAIQALTIHGAFFERKCQEIVHQAKDWSIRDTNYPVEYKGEVSNLDIWAERMYIPSRLLLPVFYIQEVLALQHPGLYPHHCISCDFALVKTLKTCISCLRMCSQILCHDRPCIVIIKQLQFYSVHY